jgi:hypothetical protein
MRELTRKAKNIISTVITVGGVDNSRWSKSGGTAIITASVYSG